MRWIQKLLWNLKRKCYHPSRASNSPKQNKKQSNKKQIKSCTNQEAKHGAGEPQTANLWVSTKVHWPQLWKRSIPLAINTSYQGRRFMSSQRISSGTSSDFDMDGIWSICQQDVNLVRISISNTHIHAKNKVLCRSDITISATSYATSSINYTMMFQLSRRYMSWQVKNLMKWA